MDCYSCDQAATQRCAVCGNQYCLSHGDDVCSACLDPATAAPSGTAFRISVFALLGVSVFALWLLVRPPSLPSQPSGVLQAEPTPIAGPVASTPSPRPTLPPVATPTPSPTPTPNPTPSPTPTPAPTPIAYTVVSGDTFYGIAGSFGVDAEELARANGLTLADFLRPGDVLIIPAVIPTAAPGVSPTPVASPSPAGPVTYIVAEGNTIYGIADLFGVSADDLLAINGLNAGDLLQVGDILLIPQ